MTRRASARVVFALLAAASLARAAEPEGKSLYDSRCAPCHGPTGGGDGPAAQALHPPPSSFRDAAFWKTRNAAQLHDVVKHGKPGTLMAGFEGALSEAEIDAVVRHVESFRPH